MKVCQGKDFRVFYVVLEGPQGGIWFWSLFGLEIALLIYQKEQLKNVVQGQSE